MLEPRESTAQTNPDQYLTSGEAARLLGVSSRNTVKNWLESGYFPNAFKTHGGHWRFPKAEVLAAKEALRELQARNLNGDLTPSDVGDLAPPLL